MAELRHAVPSGPVGLERGVRDPGVLDLGVTVHWCGQCRADVTVQIVQLAVDPEPVAVCAECGAGVDMWLSAELVGPSASRYGRPRRQEQGAA